MAHLRNELRRELDNLEELHGEAERKELLKQPVLVHQLPVIEVPKGGAEVGGGTLAFDGGGEHQVLHAHYLAIDEDEDCGMCRGRRRRRRGVSGLCRGARRVG